MADPNVEALRTVYERWGQGNFRPVEGVYGPDLEWGWSDEFLDLAGVVREPEATSDGRASRLEVFSSRDKALRAAGLERPG